MSCDKDCTCIDGSLSGTLNGMPHLSGSLSIPKGGGGYDKFFEYSQTAPSSKWFINHPLNKFPSVTVVDSGGSVVIGDIEYVDNSNIIITFNATFSGKAYLN